MDLNKNKYKSLQIVTYLKKNNLVFFFLKMSQNTSSWSLFTKNLIKNIQFFIVSKKMAIQMLKRSVYSNFKTLNNHVFVLVSSKKSFFNLASDLETNSFLSKTLAIKFNNQIYPINFLEYNYCFKYSITKLLVFKCYSANFKKKSK